MKICVTAVSDNLDAQVDPRFGRCQYFIIVDPDTLEFEAIRNPSINAMSGAGIQSAQIISNKGVEVVITGNVGPNALQVLTSAGIKIQQGASGTVRDVIEKFKKGELKSSLSDNIVATGFGARRGMGRGMGMGRGRGLAQPYPMYPSFTAPTTESMSKEQEIQMLEDHMKSLQQQLENIKRRMEELKKE